MDHEVSPIEEELLRGTQLLRAVYGPLLDGFGGAGPCIDAYEAGVRAATDFQRSVARGIDIEPAHSIAASLADLTRDMAAAQVSTVRWLLDA
jgi:hypothetical protein